MHELGIAEVRELPVCRVRANLELVRVTRNEPLGDPVRPCRSRVNLLPLRPDGLLAPAGVRRVPVAQVLGPALLRYLG